MSYVINITKDGKHYFATAKRSLRTESETIDMFRDFVKRFPKEENFSITVSKEVYYGTPVETTNWVKTPAAKQNLNEVKGDIAKSLGIQIEMKQQAVEQPLFVEQQVEEPLDPNKPIFFFRNEALRELWNEELTGQISDGAWENTPHTNYHFWCTLQTAIGPETKIIGEKPWVTTKYNFNFAGLVEYVGDRMVEIGQKHDHKYEMKQLRKDLVEIKKAMKRFGGLID